MLIRSTKKVHKPLPKSTLQKGVEAVGEASDSIQESTLLGATLTAGGSLARSFKAFPDFVYPSIHDATPLEHSQIMETLDSLPLKHVADTQSIKMVPEIPNPHPNYVTNGNARSLVVSNQINLSRAQLTTADKLRGTLTHEIGHTTDFSTRPFGLLPNKSSRQPYGEGPHITDYAKTNHYEDFAETYEEYHIRPENLKKNAPEKYADMEGFNQQSFLERLVDRKEFRDTGKYISEVIGPNRATRHVVQGAYHVSSLLQLSHGITQWSHSKKSGDSMAHVSGILNTAASALFLSGMTPLAGMAVQGAHHALSGAVKRDRLNGQEVEAVVSTPVKPLEAVLGRETKKIESSHRVGKVAAVAAGGAIGGAAGALIGPYAGVLAGHAVAGGLGGAVGMVAGGLVGFLGGAELGGRLGGGIASLVGADEVNNGLQYAGGAQKS